MNQLKESRVPIIVVLAKCDAFRKHFQAEADAEDHLKSCVLTFDGGHEIWCCFIFNDERIKRSSSTHIILY